MHRESPQGRSVSFLEGAPQGVRRWAGEEIAAADHAYAALSNPAGAGALAPSSSLRRIAGGTLTLAVAAGLIVGVYDMGGGSSKAKSGQAGTTEPRASRAATKRASPS